ncbi:MAG: hypothetical protein MUF34_17650 [Polyangiaceae bacterium]|nr:hypothetical protein [Polyangiaceae bacterium]
MVEPRIEHERGLERAITCSQKGSTLPVSAATLAIACKSVSGTTSETPSVMSRKRSRASWIIGSMRSSTSESGRMPSARVILLLSGCAEASSGRRRPASTICCTIEWSRVSGQSWPLRSRYARLSPMCATSVPPGWMSSATQVEPGREGLLSMPPSEKTCLPAPTIELRSTSPGLFAAGAAETSRTIVAMARLLASLPDECPPMPSQTTSRWPRGVSW